MDGDWLAVAMLLGAAALHASWNALTKRSTDPLLALWMMATMGGLVAGAFTPLVSFPAAEARPYLAGSLVLHLAYMLLLAFAYRLGDLSQVYPIARGLAPCIVAALAAVFAGEPLTTQGALGTLLVAGSIASLAMGRGSRPRTPAVAAALGTGLLIGGYTYLDAQGVRASASPFDFIVWSLFLDAVPITCFVLCFHARRLATISSRDLRNGLGGGVMVIVAYGTVMWAMSWTAMAGVAAIRETSVVFAAWIGTQLLGEPFGRRRLLASVGVASGILLIVL